MLARSFHELVDIVNQRGPLAPNDFPRSKTSESYGLYTIIPQFFRAFMFRILSATEVRAYLYVVLHLMPYRALSLSGQMFGEDCGLQPTSKRSIYGPLQALEKKGFLLRERRGYDRHNASSILWFQRPSYESTLIALLAGGYLTSRLQPRIRNKVDPNNAQKTEHEKRFGAIVTEALGKMIGDDAYNAILELADERKRRVALIEQLSIARDALLARHKEEAQRKGQERTRRKARAKRTGTRKRSVTS